MHAVEDMRQLCYWLLSIWTSRRQKCWPPTLSVYCWRLSQWGFTPSFTIRCTFMRYGRKKTVLCDQKSWDVFENGIQERTGRSLNIPTTLKLSQGNVYALMVSELSLHMKKFSYKIITKNLIWKYSETATPWVFDQTRWNLASQVRPNVPSTNLSSIPPTFARIVNFIFSCVLKWNDSVIKSFQRVLNRN